MIVIMSRFKLEITNKNTSVDKVLISLILIILGFGVFMVYEASVVYSDNVFGGKYHFLILQSGWALIGLIGMVVLSFLDINVIKKYIPYLYVTSVIMLIFVLLPTIFAPEVYGARRWIVLNPKPLPEIPGLGRASFQPSEVAKLSTLLFISLYLSSEKQLKKKSTRIIGEILMLVGLVSVLIFLQPDFKTGLMVALISFSAVFFSNISLIYYGVGIPLMTIGAGIYALSSEYRRTRIQTLINPESIDKLDAGYHIRQIMITLGSGGLWGLGIGKSIQKYSYLPEVTADSIFAVIGEEFGFIGTTMVIVLFLALIMRCFKISQNTNDLFSKYFSIGIAVWIGFQALINIGAMARILPLTGIPLPLISYGGSSTVFILWALGIVLNISRNSTLNKS